MARPRRARQFDVLARTPAASVIPASPGSPESCEVPVSIGSRAGPAAFNRPRNRDPHFIETQQNQGVCQILAQSPIVGAKCWIDFHCG